MYNVPCKPLELKLSVAIENTLSNLLPSILQT